MGGLRRVFTVFLVTGMLLTGCGNGEEATPDVDPTAGEGGDGGGDTETLQVGLILPVTGPAGYYGTSLRVGLEYAFDQVNAEGGVEVGGTTYEIEPVILDDEQSPDTAQTVARRALDDGIEFLIGPLGSGTASAVQPLMAESDALWLLATATVEGPTQNPNVYRTAALIESYNAATLDWLADQPEYQRIAIATDQQHTGLVSVTEPLVEGLEDLGREVVAQQEFQLGDTDFRAPITSVLDADADLYFQRGYPAEITQMLKQTRELGGEMDILWNASFTNQEILDLVDDESLLDGVYQAAPILNLDPFLADGNATAQAIADAVGDEAGTFTAAGYDAGVIFIEALRNASAATPEAVGEALAALTPADVEGKALNAFNAQADGLLFEDREVEVDVAVTEWVSGTGWTRVN